jgi:ornithine cyclodeaminase/alanine dehydrogenase-like protein (mu-crystallin family)
MGWSAGRILAISGPDVDALLSPAACVAAVEAAFRAHAGPNAPPTGILGVSAGEGGFHLKAAAAAGWRYFVAKVNANFPQNAGRHGLPTIQGLALLFDGRRGTPLAVLDSVRLTALRTAAASAVAAKYLAGGHATDLFVVGCGVQAPAHVDAMRVVRPIRRVRLYDVSRARSERLAAALNGRGIAATAELDLSGITASHIVVTCTPSATPFLARDHVSEGTFVAAVGADNEHKLEITPSLMRHARVVVDSRAQCVAMGDLRGAIAAGVMTVDDIHAELADIVSGTRAIGPRAAQDIVIFDSTGVALEDVAAAATVYETAVSRGAGTWLPWNSGLSPATGG